MLRNFLLSLVIAMIAVQALAATPPRPATSDYLVTEGAGFLMNKGEGVYYAMTYSLRSPVSSPLYAVVSFQNPSDRKSPFRVNAIIDPGKSELLVQSPTFDRIKSGKTYKVTVFLYEDPEHSLQIDKHTQKVLFQMPAEMMAAFGIRSP